MYLIFDTETTGFPRKDASLSEQPHIVQIAMLLVDDNMQEQGCLSTLIRSDGWKIHEDATKVHGITVEKCNKLGVPIEYAENLFNEWYHSCDKVVAHNIAFDKQLIDFERSRLLGSSDYKWEKTICTMNAMTPICRLPAKFRGSEFKWPKLSEAYSYCFGQLFDKAHDALADVRATAKILQWLISNNRITI